MPPPPPSTDRSPLSCATTDLNHASKATTPPSLSLSLSPFSLMLTLSSAVVRTPTATVDHRPPPAPLLQLSTTATSSRAQVHHPAMPLSRSSKICHPPRRSPPHGPPLSHHPPASPAERAHLRESPPPLIEREREREEEKQRGRLPGPIELHQGADRLRTAPAQPPLIGSPPVRRAPANSPLNHRRPRPLWPGNHTREKERASMGSGGRKR